MCGTCEGIMSDFCPACNPEPNIEPEVCTNPDCDHGHIRFDQDGNSLTEEQFNALPEDERMEDQCECTHRIFYRDFKYWSKN